MRKKMEGTVVEVTEKEVTAVVEREEGSKSAKMRELFDMGLPIKEIAEVLDVRYNFVYNVVTNYCMMNGIELVRPERGTKKDAIIEAYKEGKSNKEIAIDLKTNYNYVFNVLRQYKQEHEQDVEPEVKEG